MQKNRGYSQKIYECDLKDNLIKIYNSIKEAADKTGICRANISSVLRNITKTAGGKKWRYVEI